MVNLRVIIWHVHACYGNLVVIMEVLSEHFHISYWNLLYGKHGDGK